MRVRDFAIEVQHGFSQPCKPEREQRDHRRTTQKDGNAPGMTRDAPRMTSALFARR